MNRDRDRDRDRINRLREYGQAQANEYQEPVLLIEDPPALPITGFKSTIPYVTLESHATDREKQAATQRIEPKKNNQVSQ